MSLLIAIAAVAAAATLGDFIWYSAGVRHTLPAGLLHGALLLTVVGGAIGSSAGRTVKALPIGTLAGLGGALTYYAIVAAFDARTYGPAIPAAWFVMWVLLATLEGRWLRAPHPRGWTDIGVRAATAAVAGGIAFGLVRHVLWGAPADAGRDYLLQFGAWAVAWAPGLLALTWSGAGHGDAPAIGPTELMDRINRGENLLILDVRSETEFASGHLPGAVNIPFNQIRTRLHDVPGQRGEELILYCGHGPRAYIAAAVLQEHRRLVYLSGHFAAWHAAHLRIER